MLTLLEAKAFDAKYQEAAKRAQQAVPHMNNLVNDYKAAIAIVNADEEYDLATRQDALYDIVSMRQLMQLFLDKVDAEIAATGVTPEQHPEYPSGDVPQLGVFMQFVQNT